MEGLPRTQSLPPRIKGKNSYASTLRNLSATNWVEIDDCRTEVSKSPNLTPNGRQLTAMRNSMSRWKGCRAPDASRRAQKGRTVMSALCATCQPLTGWTLRTAEQQFVHSKASNGYITAVFGSFGVSDAPSQPRLATLCRRPHT